MCSAYRPPFRCHSRPRLGLHILNDLPHTGGPQEHAIRLLAIKIPFPLDGAIILSCRFLKLDADPVAGLEMCCAYKAYLGETAVIQFDLLADGEGGNVHRYCRELLAWPAALLIVRIVCNCSYYCSFGSANAMQVVVQVGLYTSCLPWYALLTRVSRPDIRPSCPGLAPVLLTCRAYLKRYIY